MNRAARIQRGERGAVAILVAVVLPVMLLIFGGLIVDVGSWYSVRAQNQNGADAAALAVAQSCAAGSCDLALATSYADDNSNSNLGTGGASADLVCGIAGALAANGLHTCAQNPSCQNVHEDPTANYVTVHAVSNNEVGLFGSLSGYRTKIGACAQAAWGPAGYPDGGVAMTVSYCQWKADTTGGTSYTPAPPYPASLPRPYPAEHLIQLSQIGDPTNCTPPQGASALPGGFGEVVPNGQDQCTTTISSDGWYSSNTGSGNSSHWVDTCAPVFADDQANQTVVGIPVFDDLSGNGSGGEYHLSNLAGFVITAYYFQTGNGGWAGSYIPDSPYTTKNALKNACTNSVCIVGYYVQYVDPGAPLGSGTNYGVTVPPKLVG